MTYPSLTELIAPFDLPTAGVPLGIFHRPRPAECRDGDVAFGRIEFESLMLRPQASVRCIGSGDGRIRDARIAADDWLRRWRGGDTIIVDNFGTTDAALSSWQVELGRELGIPAQACQLKIIMSPTGASIAMHFDRYDAFHLQVRGSKRWAVSNEPAVANPLHTHDPAASTRALLSGYAPAIMSPDASSMREVSVNPGDIMFMPRGFWHGTRTTEDSVSLVVRCATPAWLQLLPSALRAPLLPHEPWREPSYGGFGMGARCRTAEARLAGLLARFEATAHLEARRLIESYSFAPYEG
jgi:50S ribosomal protein L16 3-hydroxylase